MSDNLQVFTIFDDRSYDISDAKQGIGPTTNDRFFRDDPQLSERIPVHARNPELSPELSRKILYSISSRCCDDARSVRATDVVRMSARSILAFDSWRGPDTKVISTRLFATFARTCRNIHEIGQSIATIVSKRARCIRENCNRARFSLFRVRSRGRAIWSISREGDDDSLLSMIRSMM